MDIRIFRKPTKSIQDDGRFYIDTLQYRIKRATPTVDALDAPWSDWIDVKIVESDSY